MKTTHLLEEFWNSDTLNESHMGTLGVDSMHRLYKP